MLRCFLLLFTITQLIRCAAPDMKQQLMGEWSYMLDDTTYAEILITDSLIYPYHHNQNNSFDFAYNLINDTLYLLGNKQGVESSKVYFLDADSFRMPGISPVTFKKVNRSKDKPQSLATYFYRKNKLLQDNEYDIVRMLDNYILVKMHEYKAAFDANFEHRREIALYRRQQAIRQAEAQQQ